MHGDVLDRESLTGGRDHRERFGQVDGLINAAGRQQAGATTSPDLTFFDLPADALRWVFDLNLLGTILPCQVFGRQMADAARGVILNISSMNAFRPLTRIPAYSAAKAGVSNFTQWLAVHMAQNYSPADPRQRHRAGLLPDRAEPLPADRRGDRRADRARPARSSPTRRWAASASPRTCWARCCGCSRLPSAFVTGIVVPVDGGFSAFSGV